MIMTYQTLHLINLTQVRAYDPSSGSRKSKHRLRKKHVLDHVIDLLLRLRPPVMVIYSIGVSLLLLKILITDSSCTYMT